MIENIKGIVLPVITPFTHEGELDKELLCEAIDFEITAGVHALFFLGSFGQGAVMNPEERMEAAKLAIDHTRHRLPVLIHVGSADTRLSISLARHAQQAGADAIVIVSPYYYNHNEYEIIEHFKAIAAAVTLPVLIYNNPPFTNININPSLASKIVQAAPNVFGIKNGKGSLLDNLNYQRLISPDFHVFCTAGLLMPGLIYGLSGTVSPPMASFPELGVALVKAVEAKDYVVAIEVNRKILNLLMTIGKLEKKVGRRVQAECMSLRGLKIKQYPRWKTLSLSEEEKAELGAAYKKSGLSLP